jgi:uncharacterized SAM-binding protein YcdF (DUF218 family)
MEFTFLLKKFVSAFLMPLPLFVLLFAFGLYFLFTHKTIRAKLTLTLSFIWLFLISYPPLVNHILFSYESTYPSLLKPPKHIEYIYVLGGGHKVNEELPLTSQINPYALIRLNEGMRLHHLLDRKPLLITSGYSGLYNNVPGAIMQKELAIQLGMSEEKIHIEPECKDTQEEALAAKKRIGNAPFILVTSAFHMKRAMALFKQEGLNPIPAPTNHSAEIKNLRYFNFFSPSAMKKFHIIWHEMLGTLWQRIKGL